MTASTKWMPLVAAHGRRANAELAIRMSAALALRMVRR
jgi:hypothetical protein